MLPQLIRSPDGRLVVLQQERRIPVQVKLCFPWSEPQRFISLRDDDENEVALVEDPSTLEPASRGALDQALAEAGFVLGVTRVVSIDEEVEIRQWVVETQQGSRSFQTHLDDWPRLLPGGDLLVRDVAGDLYRLIGPDAMDKRSKDLLWSFVD
ncbi:MAG: DUF1854 domain-containing protein [Cytophagaceae bacterium]|nr:DUF1854 domain-containing protein [Gemmatimonadaceae bacterium]